MLELAKRKNGVDAKRAKMAVISLRALPKKLMTLTTSRLTSGRLNHGGHDGVEGSVETGSPDLRLEAFAIDRRYRNTQFRRGFPGDAAQILANHPADTGRANKNGPRLIAVEGFQGSPLRKFSVAPKPCRIRSCRC